MNEIQKYILANVDKHPTDIVRLAIKKFDVSRTAVFFHIKKLKELGLIHQEGTRNKVKYSRLQKLSEKAGGKFTYVVGERGEDEIWKKDIRPTLGKLKPNVEDILRYSFTEMFNNVIDHSESRNACVVVEEKNDVIIITIHDWGVGIFKKIASYFGMTDLREAVIKLHQGKVTTDQTRHSGQGIFFTSRAVDLFIILANGYRYFKDNSEEDEWYWETHEQVDGTSVSFKVSRNSSRILKDVFDAYTNMDNFHFEKSHIRIELGKYEEDNFVSRSQAKRLLAGLNDFKTIDLDFKNIRNVGQAFVDEVFGVFGLEHPEIKFEIVNANDDILFMIKRGLNDRNIPANRVRFRPNE